MSLIDFFLLKSCSAGHPSSLCLQYLHANDPLIKPFTGKASNVNNKTSNKTNQLKLIINKTIPMTKGIIDTRKSGMISIQLIFLSINFLENPFLKNIEHSLPFPNAQRLP